MTRICQPFRSNPKKDDHLVQDVRNFFFIRGLVTVVEKELGWNPSRIIRHHKKTETYYIFGLPCRKCRSSSMQRCPQLASDRTVRPFRTTLIFCPSGDIFGIRKRKTKFRKFLSGSKFCFDKFMFESLNQRYVLFLPFSHCGPCVSKESLIKPRITNETFVIFPRMICHEV